MNILSHGQQIWTIGELIDDALAEPIEQQA
jgi:hypothetical protein